MLSGFNFWFDKCSPVARVMLYKRTTMVAVVAHLSKRGWQKLKRQFSYHNWVITLLLFQRRPEGCFSWGDQFSLVSKCQRAVNCVIKWLTMRWNTKCLIWEGKFNIFGGTVRGPICLSRVHYNIGILRCHSLSSYHIFVVSMAGSKGMENRG